MMIDILQMGHRQSSSSVFVLGRTALPAVVPIAIVLRFLPRWSSWVPPLSTLVLLNELNCLSVHFGRPRALNFGRNFRFSNLLVLVAAVA